jgi:hypothetical protein
MLTLLTCKQFVDSLKSIKEVVVDWSVSKHRMRGAYLREIKSNIEKILHGNHGCLLMKQVQGS